MNEKRLQRLLKQYEEDWRQHNKVRDPSTLNNRDEAENTKLIFLDIDEVLALNHSPTEGWHMPSVENLKKIIEATDARLIISSTWRLGYADHDMLRFDNVLSTVGLGHRLGIRFDYSVGKTMAGYDTVYEWKTPSLAGIRGIEIIGFFESLKEKHGVDKENSYVIIDDSSDFTDEQKANNFVHINPRLGITDKARDQAINILNGAL